MTVTAVPEPLAPAEAAWLLDFARVCRAAARAVSLYPREHPAIASALDRLVRVCQSGPAEGDAQMWVFPDGLRLNQRRLAQPDAAVTELAQMLHERRVGELTIQPGATAAYWRLFLSVLAQAPDDLLARGGFARVWTTSGGQLIEIREIDYSELLKERFGGHAESWDRVFQQFLQGGLHFDDAALEVVLEAAQEPARLAEIIEGFQKHAEGTLDAQAMGGAVARMLGGALKLAADPERRAPAAHGMAAALSTLPPGTVATILTADPRGDAGLSPELRQEIVANLPDVAVADFVSRTVVEQGGPSARLAEAFQVLVPDLERQQALLALARRGAATALGDDASFDELWRQVEEVLLSYTDTSFVSTEYGDELTRAQKQTSAAPAADPPERVAAWLGSVSDDEVKVLDHQLVLDLLRIEDEPARWNELMPIAASHATALAVAGRLEPAISTLEAIRTEAVDAASPRRQAAASTLEHLARTEVITGIASHIADADDRLFADIARLFHAMGAPVIRPLAEALAKEQRSNARLRLRTALLGFGAVGRQAIEPLKSSPDADVRRTAVHLLREFGGHDALPDLASLLDDREPHVQREAIDAILLIGTPEAYDSLIAALGTGNQHVRDTLMNRMARSRDEAPISFLCHVVDTIGPSGRLRDIYQRSLELLGDHGDASAIDALRQALYRGDWWAPRRTKTLRSIAARSLSRIGTPQSRAVLADALAHGVRGVRAAVRPYAHRD